MPVNSLFTAGSSKAPHLEHDPLKISNDGGKSVVISKPNELRDEISEKSVVEVENPVAAAVESSNNSIVEKTSTKSNSRSVGKVITHASRSTIIASAEESKESAFNNGDETLHGEDLKYNDEYEEDQDEYMEGEEEEEEEIEHEPLPAVFQPLDK